MKKISVLLSVVCLIASVFALAIQMPQDACYGAGVLDILSPQVIVFYEDEIAHKQVVSDKPAEWLERVGNRYDISVQKVKAVLVVQDFCAICGDEKSFVTLAKCQDYELLVIVKDHVEGYLNSLDDAQKHALIQKANEIFSLKTK